MKKAALICSHFSSSPYTTDTIYKLLLLEQGNTFRCTGSYRLERLYSKPFQIMFKGVQGDVTNFCPI
jgi:hypothetical protein